MRANWRAASPPTSRPPAARCRWRTSPRSAPIIASRCKSPIAVEKCLRRPSSPRARRSRRRCAACRKKLSPGRAPDAAAYAEYALALQAAYRERLSDMGDADGRRALGAEHLAPACTTHFAVVDKDGNMAAVTQTLLSTFGSKFVTPETGITMNNGIMWFDPTLGVPNSLAPGKRCLTNYTPVVAEASDGRRMAAGASGGRRILPAVTQLLSFVMDYGMDLDAAIHQPRIDASEGAIVIGDVRLPNAVHDALRVRFDYEQARIQTFPMKFACPSVALRDGTTNFGATEAAHAWGDAVAENY